MPVFESYLATVDYIYSQSGRSPSNDLSSMAHKGSITIELQFVAGCSTNHAESSVVVRLTRLAYVFYFALFAVGDPIHYISKVVRYQQRSILQL